MPSSQATLTSTNDALTVPVTAEAVAGLLGIQLTGTWTGTVSFEATIDGSTWVAISVTPVASTTTVTTATAVGAWQTNCAGLSQFRARFSTASSGSVVATARG